MQIRCGDLYNDKAIATFNACAVSDQKCVPQKIDRDVFPEPKPEVLDKDFDLGKFQVRLPGFQILVLTCICGTARGPRLGAAADSNQQNYFRNYLSNS